MSFFSSLIFIFLFCLSVNLCTARHLELLFRMGSTAEVPFSREGSVGEGKTYGGAIDHNAKETGAAVKEVKHVGKGSEILGFSCLPDLQETAKLKGSRRQPRSILEYADSQDAEVMDYETPHGKPPIHNKPTN